MPAAKSQTSPAQPGPDRRWTRSGQVNAAIVVITVLAIGLRLYQLTRPQYLLGVTEYDDGTDFGSAVLLIHGYLPYRDFIIVQPPGITLLMAPVAAATKTLGTAWGMGVGRILTAVAGGAAAGLTGLLVRQRGLLAVILASGIVAVYPASVQAAHTVLLEPWLVLFCLLGALAVFDGDQLAGSWRRLVWGGLAFGFAGAVKVWAVLPVLVILVLAARRPRRALGFAAGVAVGFLAPVLPFAALAPRTFYNSVVLAQLVRVDVVRVTLSYRLHQMTGLTDFSSLGPVPLTIVTVAIIARDRGLRRGRHPAVRAAAAAAGAVRLCRDRADHHRVPLAGRLLLPLRRLPGPVPGPGHRASGGPAGGHVPARDPARHCARGRTGG